MSDVLRVAAAVEGPTDAAVLRAILPKILGREVVVTVLQPTDESVALSDGGASGFGWRGVLRWCDEVREAGGVAALGAFTNNHLLVVHLDGDVARDAAIACARPCPPAADTADALRALLRARMGLPTDAPRVVLMIPMDATEAWLLAMLRNVLVDECRQDPAAEFMGGRPKLLEQSGKKKTPAYKKALQDTAWSWPAALGLSQAARFDRDVRTAVAQSPPLPPSTPPR